MKDVIVVGAGLTGMLIARMLHDAGLKVMLIDQSELGHESSWTSSGIVPPLFPWLLSDTANTLIRHSQQQLPGLCATLLEETRLDPQLLDSGMLLLDTPPTPAMTAWAEKFGQPLELLESPQAISERCPGLSEQYQSAIYLPNVSQVRNPSMVQALATSLRLRPVLISKHQPVTAINTRNNRVTGVVLGNETFEADQVVIAAGAWSTRFPELRNLLPGVDIVRKEMILLRGKRGRLPHIVVQGDRYLVPRRDGRILCGAERSIGSFDKTPDQQVSDSLRLFANQLLPYTTELPIRNHWAGIHAIASDGLPCVGAHPEIAGLWFNAGNGGSTMATSLASAEILVDRILDRPNALGLRECLNSHADQ